MDLLKRIVKWLEDKKIYQRERKINKQRALGMLLYNAGQVEGLIGDHKNLYIIQHLTIL